jgi:hypothetical protein
VYQVAVRGDSGAMAVVAGSAARAAAVAAMADHWVGDPAGMASARDDGPLAMATDPCEAEDHRDEVALHTCVEAHEAGFHVLVMALAVGLEPGVLDRMDSLGAAAERDSEFQPGDHHSYRRQKEAAAVGPLIADSGHVVPIAVLAGNRQHQADMPADARPAALAQRHCREQAFLH